MTAPIEINFASPDDAPPHPDLELFAAKLGQEMEATLEQAVVAEGLLTFTEKYAPNLWWITDTVLVEGKRKILGVKIDADDEPTVHTLAAYLTVALRNQVSDLNLTRALYAYGFGHETQRYAERLAEYAEKLAEVHALGEEIFPLAGDTGPEGGWTNPRKVERAPHGTGYRFILDNGTVIQVLHQGTSVEISNASDGTRPNASGLSVRMGASNRFKVTEAR